MDENKYPNQQPQVEPQATPAQPTAEVTPQFYTAGPAIQTAPGGQSSPWRGAFAAYRQVLTQVQANPQPAVVLVLTIVAFALIDQAILGDPTPLSKAFSSEGDTNAAGSISTFAQLLLSAALITYGLAVADRKPITISQLFGSDVRTFIYTVLTLLLFSVIIIGSAFLLLIPLIWTLPWFYLAMFVAVDKKLGPVRSLKESKRSSQSHIGKVWGYFGITILLAIPLAFISGIPVIGAIPGAVFTVLSFGAAAVLYRWLQQGQPQQ